MAAASRIPAHLPNMNAPSISFIRKLGEFLTTNQLLWQDAELDPGPQRLISALFVCCHSVSPAPHNRMCGTCVKWNCADVVCVTHYYTCPHVHTPTRSRHISCATHPPGSVRPYRPRMHADHARAHPWPPHHMPRSRNLRSVLRGPNRRSL